MNCDIEVIENWLFNLVNCLESSKNIGCVGPKQINENGKISGTAIIGSNNDRQFFGMGASHDDIRYNKSIDCISLSGSCFVVKRAVLNEIGLFDENYFLFFEETDLHFRIRDHGYRVAYCPQSVIYHYFNKAPKNDINVREIFEKSERYFEKKFKNMLKEIK